MSNFKLPRLIANTLRCATIVCAVASVPAFAQVADAHAHDVDHNQHDAHSGHETQNATLSLNQGERWQPDEPLRKGRDLAHKFANLCGVVQMKRIRFLRRPAFHAIQALNGRRIGGIRG